MKILIALPILYACVWVPHNSRCKSEFFKTKRQRYTIFPLSIVRFMREGFRNDKYHTRATCMHRINYVD